MIRYMIKYDTMQYDARREAKKKSQDKTRKVEKHELS